MDKKSESTLEEIKRRLESIDRKLDLILKPASLVATSDAYGSLPWKNFENDEGSWILADQKGAEQLVKRLKNAQGNTVFSSEYRFSLSKDGRFVRRHPLKNSNGGECRCRRMDT